MVDARDLTALFYHYGSRTPQRQIPAQAPSGTGLKKSEVIKRHNWHSNIEIRPIFVSPPLHYFNDELLFRFKILSQNPFFSTGFVSAADNKSCDSC
jgi:hypothetical protein